jgi:ArsR family transcriptional regulator, arsenate/arsenite/antimonite-responsive transcriptional repressor
MRDLVTRMAEVFKALGDPTRLRILRILASHPNQKVCVGRIAERVGVSQPAASQHLRVLKQAGLVEPNREGFRVHYMIVRDALAALRIDWDALCAPAAEESPCHEHEACQEKQA